MDKIIIFDFNRTIYNPETNSLFPFVNLVLTTLQQRSFILFLISYGDCSRKKQIDKLGIKKYFKKIIITKQKSLEHFQKIINAQATDFKNSYVIGDRVTKEIKFGNKLHLQTIRIEQGKFKGEKPNNMDEQPDYSTNSLKNILDIVH